MERKITACGAYLLVRAEGGARRVTCASPGAEELLSIERERLLGSDPDELPIECLTSELELPDGTVVMLLDEAETAKLRFENRALKNELHKAHEEARAKTSFLSSMSHDIRTPMNAIIGMTNIAINHIDEKNRVSDSLGKIQTASKHLMSLINDVLDMSRIESGRTTINEEEFSLADLVHDLSVMMRPLAVQRRQSLSFDVSGIEWENMLGDTLYLRQIFVNIISNAVKYTQVEGTIDVRFSQKSVDGQRVMLCFTCQDNGIGMTKDFLKRIFTPFERDSAVFSSGTEGTGLGMSITHGLVQKMGGEITVESEIGEGSRFDVCIPLAVCGEKEHEGTLSGKLVLVVEPDETQSETVCGYLRDGGAEVKRVSSGTDAVMWIAEMQFEDASPCAVLLGDGLGDGDMLDLAGHLRSQLGEGPLIMLLSHRDWSRIEYSAQRAGVTGFIPCPIFRDRLLRALAGTERTATTGEDRTDFTGMHVLLAEDNELNREIAVELIEDTGAVVETAENGQEAVEIFASSEEGHFDLVLMDIQMPVMDGFEAVRRIRALERRDARTVCIAAMTANAFVEDMKKTRAAGMNEHISKPVDFRRLEELLLQVKRGRDQSAAVSE